MMISQKEAIILKFLWSKEGSCTCAEVTEGVREETGWQEVTVRTFLNRMVKKGSLSAYRRGVYFYSPLVTKKEYMELQAKGLASFFSHSEMKDFILTLVSAEGITEAEIQMLSSRLNENTSEKKDNES